MREGDEGEEHGFIELGRVVVVENREDVKTVGGCVAAAACDVVVVWRFNVYGVQK